MEKIKTLVPDTSILIHGELSDMIKAGKMNNVRLIIPRAVVDELQAQASRGKEIGFQGLEEIKKIREHAKAHSVKVEFTGNRPTMEEIQLAKKGRIDAIIRDVAAKYDATLMTADYVQALVGEAEGVDIQHVKYDVKKEALILEKFFTPDTQSVHLKVGIIPYAKRGRPGEVKLHVLGEERMEENELKKIIDQIESKVRVQEDGFTEMNKHGAMVIQLGKYRIAITRPPFSDRLEVTAVRPVTKCTLADYNLHKELEDKIVTGSYGVLIAGPPGSGKSTFAASIADFLSSKGKVVKTFEQPRDLQVGPEVTQYAPLEGDWEKTSEILLLVRPDYTIFDEIRKTKDFRVFADMRLAGVGMIGVVHSTNPVSAIQRFIGRLELGTIPHVIDTVIYISAGKILKTYEIRMIVKVPSGMKEADLARPVVEVRDYETKRLEYEIYTYGEENVVMPVGKHEKSPVKELAKGRILQELRNWDPHPEIEFESEDRVTVKVRNDAIASLIGKKGSNIEALEKRLGVHISVEPKEKTLKRSVPFGFEEIGSHFDLKVNHALTGEQLDIYSGEDFLFSAMVGKGGRIRVKKKSSLGKAVLQAIASNRLKIFGKGY
ncbi:MAG: PINc/VapC family ATPase [Candidatus Aenigmarchaeota archaeon]|nr:PINc/VapC family ATPase [Candidatus Aenigmarchaeota archaeon]